MRLPLDRSTIRLGGKMKNILRIIAALAASSALCGCAELNSIHRTTGSPGDGQGRVVTVDAKQRHLLMMPEIQSSTAGTKWRVCAEAAPDVFSALASSFAAQGNKSGGQLSIANSETASTIERTQTINMLRESFYRTCERYASGAITRTQFVVQAARDQRSMVAVLAIEQLTGALRPKATIISGPGTSASTLSNSEAARLVRDLHLNLVAAQKKRDEADLAVAAAADGVCSSDDEKSDAAKCTALKSAAATAKTDVESAEVALAKGQELAKTLSDATLVATTNGATFQGGEVAAANIKSEHLATVAEAIVKIQGQSAINEPLMFCIGYLSDPDATSLGKAVQKLAKAEAKNQSDSEIGNNLRRSEETDGKIVTSCLQMLADQQQRDNKFRLFDVNLSPEDEKKVAIDLANYRDFNRIMINNLKDTQLPDWNNLWGRFTKMTSTDVTLCNSPMDCKKKF